jgi:hypothetical protein
MTESQTIKVYYWDHEADEGISSDEPQEATVGEAIDYMEMLPITDGDFLGLELAGGETIQFMYNEDESIHVDIPDTEKAGSYTKTVDIDECVQMIRDIYGGKKPAELEGIVFESWS